MKLDRHISVEQWVAKKANVWLKIGQTRSLALFHSAAKRVPAYRDWLRKQHINPRSIKTWHDFQAVPPMNKKNYLRQYPLKKLCWDGTLARPLVFTSTSGSTGEPFYFPRHETLERQYSYIVELFLKNSSYRTKGPILVIVCFGMGVWIGGLVTYRAFEIAAERLQAPISIITPGINKGEIFAALQNLAPNFSQTIIIGYPPFVKDIIDESPAHGIHLSKMNVRLLFAAEGFTEKFRSYLAHKAHIKNVHRDMLNVYGSADIGAMAYESTIAILIKRLASNRSALFQALFGPIKKTPTLAQFNPLFIQFESLNGEIALTGNNALPLIRYAIGDSGGVLNYDTIEEAMARDGVSLPAAMRKADIPRQPQFPFVYLYERSDFSTKLYGAIIYPEHVRLALQTKPHVDQVTGKFTMATRFNKNNEQYLEINIETKPGVKISPAIQSNLTKTIVQHLVRHNSEYQNNYKTIPHKVTPELVFWEYGENTYFKPGVKQKWVQK